ncbi:MAG: alpha-L-fucosidase [Microthrixaceae bacterium]|nr:alpha-L-fucosidase [Microthrixaceae bacterium]MCB1011467.1 alpha-L-fucosidase [Microthrixaceae bacterium]MCO5320041.1 alpha-L-fucosidase [Microthrixaceae bacterium]
MSSRTALKELRRHRVPAWWSDAKVGIFIHWTPAAVPGWAPVDSEIGDLLAAGREDALAENPYTEWYENSIRFPQSSASRHHRETYGDKPYSDFAEEFSEALASWNPDDWARSFAATGARYVVLVAKHHDGWCLWPTEVVNPNRPNWFSRRDIVGELREAVLAAGMRFGVYYSGGLDWTFDDRPIGNLGDMLAAIPRGDYPAYADAQVRELIDRYSPSVLWNDIAWPSTGAELWPTMQHYYRRVPDGVVNDRWMPWSPAMAAAGLKPVRRAANSLNARVTRSSRGLVPPKPPHFDVRTPEYVVFDDVQRHPWECVRGMDQSFGYNRNSGPDHFLSDGELLEMTGDIVAKGGNLLLNVGPKGEDATIPDRQLSLLGTLGNWTGSQGASIFASRPWIRPVGESVEGHGLRYWARDRSLFVAVDQRGGSSSRGGAADSTVTLREVAPSPTTVVRTASGEPVTHTDAPEGLQCVWTPSVPWSVLEITDARCR